MLWFIILTAMVLSSMADAEGGVEIFNGSKYQVEIKSNCDEGEMTCNKITFYSKSKKSGKGITLKGSTVNSDCPGSCDFRGYQYKNGDYSYTILSNQQYDNVWALAIMRKNKVIDIDKGSIN